MAAFLLAFFILPSLLFSNIEVTVVQVLSGDTVELSNGEVVRLLGIDAPESQKNMKLEHDLERSKETESEILEQGGKAKQFTKDLVEGKTVRLEFDLYRRDGYGRQLANIYMPAVPQELSPGDSRILVGEDGHKEVFVNATIINSGYAYPFAVPPNVKNVNYFLELFKDAQEHKRGLWQ